MKRLLLAFLIFACSPTFFASAQETSAEQREKLERLSADMEALIATNAKLQTEISKLKEELARVREDNARPANDPNIPGLREDLRKLAEKIQEVDRKRIDDKEIVAVELEKIEKLLKGFSAGIKSSSRGGDTPARSRPGNAYEYVVQPGDTLSKILVAVNAQLKDEKKKTVTQKQVLDANEGLNPDRLFVGQKLYIPAE